MFYLSNSINICATFIYIQDGFTPLHYASQNGHTDTVKQLLKARVSPHALTKVRWMVCAELVYSNKVYPKLYNREVCVTLNCTCSGFCVGT